MTKLKFGLTIPQGWWSDLPTNDPIKQYEFSKKISRSADRLNFYGLYAYDHFIPHHEYNINNNFFECFTLLSSISSITKKIRLGQIVTCNSYRNPALLAKVLSTLDVISKGRVELGIGAGWYQNEYSSYGYNFPSNVERIKQLDESISIIKAMWKYERASFHGNYFSINEAICKPHPIQKPYPPIIVGGTGEKYLLKIVAKHADIYNNPFGSPADLRKKLIVLKEHCHDLRKSYNDIELSVLLPCIIKESEKDVLIEINKWKKKNENISAFLERKSGGYTIGTPEKILLGLQQYIDLGITHFILNFIGLEDYTLHLFDSRVIKKL